MELHISKILGGERVPGSGAFKLSNKNLKGDVHVDDVDGHPFLYVECKGTGNLSPKGDHSFTLKRDVLEQMFRESTEQHQIGVVWIHWKHANYLADDYAILETRHLAELVRLAKLGARIDRKGEPS